MQRETVLGEKEEETVGRLTPGAQVLVRDEVWLVRNTSLTTHDGEKVTAVGVSDLVRDEEATFFTGIDEVVLLRPEETELVADGTPSFRRSRLFLESVIRRTPLPQAERGLALAHQFLLDPLVYQQRPAELALDGIRPRILIADVVGLGKTLEIGLILAELIRRGRGDRILVVTPQQVLGQFQRELWTRFSIPLIRLDSVGIQRIQRDIPAGRNPFTYFKRVIISIDTLKNISQYRHHLECIWWDAVVIDESHNLIGGGNLRNQLAQVLAPRTDALLLASATPHNGDAKSFAKLINLLDPAAIADTGNYTTGEISHLYIRRTKISPEVRDQLSDEWADRGPSLPIRCAATLPEEAVFAELANEWLPESPPPTGRAAAPGRGGDRLFPYTLLKAFLSSHKALDETVTRRLSTGSNPSDGEQAALTRLQRLARGIGDGDSAKLAALLKTLEEIEVGPHSDVRVVIFSERVDTLTWLAEVVPARLGFTAKQAGGAVEVLNGSVADTEQDRILERFGLADSPSRILFTSDLASEGIDLHRECHHLIHYDLPWSLIRIEQRNGRIDRYGQTRSPEFRALVLTSGVDGAKDDTTVAEKLLEREAEAHAKLGTAEAVTGEYTADREENRLIQDLLAGRTVEESLAAAPSPAGSVLAGLLGEHDAAAGVREEPKRAAVPTLFDSTRQFFDEAIREVCPNPEDTIGLSYDDNAVFLDPPKDLQRRLSVLPPSYLKERKVQERLRVTFDRDLATRKLRAAQQSDKILWPDTAYLSDLHPLIEWLVDKLLVRLGRQQAPVLLVQDDGAAVDGPTFLVQGVYSNKLGRPTVLEWMAVSGLPRAPRVDPMFEVLAAAGVRSGMYNLGTAVDLAALQQLVPAAVEAARAHLETQEAIWAEAIAEPLRRHEERLRRFEQLTLLPKARSTVDEQRELAGSLRTAGPPLLRLLAVLTPQTVSSPRTDLSPQTVLNPQEVSG